MDAAGDVNKTVATVTWLLLDFVSFHLKPFPISSIIIKKNYLKNSLVKKVSKQPISHRAEFWEISSRIYYLHISNRHDYTPNTVLYCM